MTAAWRRVTALPYAPVTAAVLLGMLAVTQALWVAVDGAPNGGRTLNGGATAEWWLSLFVLALVSLATTTPLGFLWAGRPGPRSSCPRRASCRSPGTRRSPWPA